MDGRIKLRHVLVAILIGGIAIACGVYQGHKGIDKIEQNVEQEIDAQEKVHWDIEVKKMEEATPRPQRSTNTFRVIPYFSHEEIGMIFAAAKRNNLNTELAYILFAIRKAENGKAGKEFGIMNPEANDFDSQAGWCAATIKKNYDRWIDAGCPDDFITFLGSKYCPVGAENDPNNLNQHWVGNVKEWVEKVAVR